MKNRVSGVLMEVGAEYNKKAAAAESGCVGDVSDHAGANHRHVGQTSEVAEKNSRGGRGTSLAWALEVGEPRRFSSIDHAVSYCGLTSVLDAAEKQRPGRQTAL